MSNRDFDTKDVYGGYRHGSAEVTITRELSPRVNGHYSLNYVYTSLKKKILNELGVTDIDRRRGRILEFWSWKMMIV